MSPASPGWTICSTNSRRWAASSVPLGCGEVAEKSARRSVADALDRALVEAARLELHDLGLLADDTEAERPHAPHRPAVHESVDVLPPDERDVLAEAVAKLVDQERAVFGFLVLHLVEHRRRRRIRLAQAVGEIAVDAAVLFLQRDRERENLGLCQVAEVFRHVR